MASKQSYIGRIVSQVATWLAVPRVVTLPILVLAGLGGGQLLWLYVDSVKVLAWASGMATPFCMMCATVVWAMRDRLDEAFDTDQMTSQEYQRLVDLVLMHRSRSTQWAAVTGLMALISSIPAVSNQLIGPVWHWMALSTGAAVAISIHAYLLANYWDHQVRAFRNKQRLDHKKNAERRVLLESLSIGKAPKSGVGWVDGPNLDASSGVHH